MNTRTALMRILGLCFSASLALQGCLPSDSPVTPFDRGDEIRSSVDVGARYSLKVFYKIETGSAVRTDEITKFDLGFACAADAWHIVSNTAQIMSIANAGAVPFESVTSQAGLQFTYDAPSGNLDSTAVGTWWTGSPESPTGSLNNVYVVDRGYDAEGKQLGRKKFTATPTQSGYSVRFANLDGSDEYTVEIQKDPRYQFIGLSFNAQGSVVECEPPKDTWDIVFTRYTHLFYTPEFMPYAVTGVLLNRGLTTVGVIDSANFASVNQDVLSSVRLLEEIDYIGYNWKEYNLADDVYTVDADRVYIIRDRSGIYYKFHFLDYYDNTGRRGVPQFAYRKL